MIFKIILNACTLLLCMASYGQTPAWQWANAHGGLNMDIVYDLASDNTGNLYSVGLFSSPTIVFGSDTLVNHSPAGDTADIFIVKYDGSGNVLWATSAGGTGLDVASAVAVDSQGYICLAGSFSTPSIDFGSTTLTSSGSSDIFVAKYDPNGNFLWARGAGGSESDVARAIDTDALSNIYIGGTYNSSSFSIGVDTLINSASSGTSDTFTAKYGSNGAPLWAKSGGGSSNDNCYGIAVDDHGNAFIAGTFSSSTASFGVLNISGSGTYDVFILKYDSTGNELWLDGSGGGFSDIGLGVDCDFNGNAYLVGGFSSSSMNVGGITITNSVSSGSEEIFLAKYDPLGNVVFAKQYGGSSGDRAYDFHCIDGGKGILTGTYMSSVISFGGTTHANEGLNDIFVAGIDSIGDAQWALDAGGVSGEFSRAVVSDQYGNIYIGGYFQSLELDFGANVVSNADVSQTSYDAFVAKLSYPLDRIDYVTDSYFTIYPNPNNGIFRINSMRNSEANYKIINHFGQVVKTGQIQTISDAQINIASFPAGLYIMQVADVEGEIQRKVFTKHM
jgi:hypothetical protein